MQVQHTSLNNWPSKTSLMIELMDLPVKLIRNELKLLRSLALLSLEAGALFWAFLSPISSEFNRSST